MIANSQIEGGFRWDDARVLLALSRSGTLQGAGERLSVNASTVSRRLDALEAALGVHLFDRTPDGARPTVAAEQLLPLAEQMEHAAMGLRQAVSGLESEPEGDVRISAPPGIADHMLGGALVRLYARFPRIRVHLDARIAYVDLARREADLALRLKRPTSGDLITTRLGSAPHAILTSPAYATELGVLGDPADARWITWDDDLAELPDARWVLSRVPPRQVVMRTSSIGAQIKALESGLGVAWMGSPFEPLSGLARVRLSKKLAATLDPPPDGVLWLVGHRALREVPRIAAVWDWIVAEARSLGLITPMARSPKPK